VYAIKISWSLSLRRRLVAKSSLFSKKCVRPINLLLTML